MSSDILSDVASSRLLPRGLFCFSDIGDESFYVFGRFLPCFTWKRPVPRGRENCLSGRIRKRKCVGSVSRNTDRIFRRKNGSKRPIAAENRKTPLPGTQNSHIMPACRARQGRKRMKNGAGKREERQCFRFPGNNVLTPVKMYIFTRIVAYMHFRPVCRKTRCDHGRRRPRLCVSPFRFCRGRKRNFQKRSKTGENAEDITENDQHPPNGRRKSRPYFGRMRRGQRSKQSLAARSFRGGHRAGRPAFCT